MFTRRVMLLAQIQEIFDRLSSNKNANAIKEALQIGLLNAIGIASRPNGFFGNLLIKILMPEKLKNLERTLRFVGAGKLVEEFVLSMNRAAEQAAPVAKSIFLEALRAMTIQDAIGLLRGGETAATDFFKRSTSEKLIEAFRPPITESMQSVGAVRNFEKMVERFQRIPFVKKEPIDIEGYVTTKAVAGLFFLVGEEEKKIRKDPAARTTQLLRDVFGALGRR